MTTYLITTTYYAGTEARVTLPDDKTWDDVIGWYIKWDCLHFQLKGEEQWREVSLNSDGMDIVDWKRPTNTTVYAVGEDGEVDYEDEIDSAEG